MHSFRHGDFYSFRADANALGGFLELPDRKVVPTVAPVSLPPVGGFATARADRFNLEDIVSCAAAYTRVSGVENRDGSIGILTTAIVEDLNILEVVRAERVVAQVSISLPKGGSAIDISLAGSRFEGLRVAGSDAHPIPNRALTFPASPQTGHHLPLTWQDVQKAGQSQAKALVDSFKACRDGDANQWAQDRHGWMDSKPPAEGGDLLCSLLDGFGARDSFESYGHIVVIPGFGRFHFGELFLSRASVQLVMIRAELGCPVQGKITVAAGGGGGGDGKS